MDGTQLDQLLERMPYSDGSGRRRLVTGGIVLVGIALIMYQAGALPDFGGEKLSVTTVLGSPTLVLVVVLAIYATGSIVEMLGEYFLVRAASGAFRALSLPRRRAAAESSRASKVAFRVLSMSLVPFLLLWHVIAGFLGRTRYSIDFASRLSPEAVDTLERLPNKVIDGLRHPVGDDAEYAFRHITETLTGESDRKWARRLFNRVKDVSAVTTSLVVVGIFAWLTSALGGSSQMGSELSPAELKRLNTSPVMRTWKQKVNALASGEQPQESAKKSVAYETAGSTYKSIKDSINSDYVAKIAEYYKEEDESDADNVSEEYVIVTVDAPESSLDDLRYLKKFDSDYFDDIMVDHEPAVEPVAVAGIELIDHIDGLLKEETNARNAVTGAASLAFLLMYVGYFTGLRNAITSIVERISIQVSRSADAAQRENLTPGTQLKTPPSNFLALDLFSAVAWPIIIMFGVISFDIIVIGYQESFPTWTMAVSFLAGTALSVWRWNRYRRVTA